ncbi:putative phosphoribosylformylglycinamidine synthase, chloroplastic/mitochondrial [Phytophthora ramorum]|uniref:phosphoribosylformylglycinamidine synthase n=1 Tax=Phytophthora ramorum TaxID=164328 RepID=H3G9D6_PHYRM|nr:putative phosphoribosylformylglycinamidine synthase, chloroplastic/mitochondrial [Phytophthora ramorum]
MASSPEKKQKTASIATASSLLRFYRTPAFTAHANRTLLASLRAQVADTGISVDELATEYCFYVETHAAAGPLSTADQETLHWLLSETFEPQQTRAAEPFLAAAEQSKEWLVEVGPRMNFSTAWSSNAVAICQACGISSIKRIERATRYLVRYTATKPEGLEKLKHALLRHQCDRMTQQVYEKPLASFWHGKTVQPVRKIPIMERGIDALKEINEEIGLGFDDWDLQYYLNLFKDKLRRNPTDVECFDMGQSNSEHSRHWFFGGKIVVDGKEMPQTLFQMVKDTLTENAKKNSVIAFHDNSSVIKGANIVTLGPVNPGEPSAVQERTLDSHLLLTAETHNFPSGVAPFPGAETGTGGRIRDVQATGRGANVVAGVSAYSVGNLNLEGYKLPWEDEKLEYPSNLAHPRDILIQASNGASDYGNKFGEPVVTGFARSFGMVLPNGERREYIKPIMFSAGLGQLDGRHCTKGEPEIQMWVVKIGGPCYRIGMGGGAASSRIQDAKTADLDFNAVQRGDAEMECKLNKVIRACCDLGEKNPIVSIHDQGAGGNGNVLKEIVEVSNSKPGDANRGGARYEVRDILVGDDTLSVLEIWGAEYQENDALLLRPEHVELFDKICKRENCPYALLGQVTGDGHVVLHDAQDDSTPFDLDLDLVLGKMPQKTFTDTKATEPVTELSLPADITLRDALDRVLRLLSVGSKRFLTSKVDRSVSGLVAQQQTVGPLQLTLADCAVVAQSNVPNKDGKFTGVVSACGEQPVKGLVNPGAMARLSVAESLTNMVWAALGGRGLDDCKCSANWMWAAKLPNEAARMYECCEAMTTFMKQVGVSVDGGKDSLSMAAKVNQKDVKTPGTLVITMYAPTEDVELKVTPDLKTHAGDSLVYYVDVGKGANRLGGSALAQVYGQVGDVTPDVEDALLFKNAFNAVQEGIKKGHLLAGHDRSDGGLIVTLLEMAFAGNCGLDVDIPFAGGKATTKDVIEVLFAEELGFVFQVAAGQHATEVESIFSKLNVPLVKLGKVTTDGAIKVSVNGESVLEDQMVDLRDVWEATSFELEKRQCNPECVAQEQRSLRTRTAPSWKLAYEPTPTPERQLSTRAQHRVAVIREEGSNGEREMLAAFHHAGFEVWDITMSDLVNKRAVLDERFRGVAFVGGFTFADVLGSAKGWSGVVKFHGDVLKQFAAFKAREDTFSFGACNGCQFMTLLGWLDHPEAKALEEETKSSAQPRFVHNESGRHESRFVSVQIQESNSVMLRGMAGSSLGVWLSHGEGRAHFTHPTILDKYVSSGAAPIRYVDDSNVPTEEYPFNPNGSPQGIAGLVSSDGRHMCLMPHPERCFLKYQWPYMPAEFEAHPVSPWMQIFQNAKTFCEGGAQ